MSTAALLSLGLVPLIAYVIVGIRLMQLCQASGVSHGWLAFVPLLNFTRWARLAGKNERWDPCQRAFYSGEFVSVRIVRHLLDWFVAPRCRRPFFSHFRTSDVSARYNRPGYKPIRHFFPAISGLVLFTQDLRRVIRIEAFSVIKDNQLTCYIDVIYTLYGLLN